VTGIDLPTCSFQTMGVAEATRVFRIQIFGLLEIPGRGMALVMELAEGGSLRAVLDDAVAHPQLDWEMRLRWLDGISAGVAKLHSLVPQPVIHRDVKVGYHDCVRRLDCARPAVFFGQKLRDAPPKTNQT
jgi:serine/threonine protein kinase